MGISRWGFPGSSPNGWGFWQGRSFCVALDSLLLFCLEITPVIPVWTEPSGAHALSLSLAIGGIIVNDDAKRCHSPAPYTVVYKEGRAVTPPSRSSIRWTFRSEYFVFLFCSLKPPRRSYIAGTGVVQGLFHGNVEESYILSLPLQETG